MFSQWINSISASRNAENIDTQADMERVTASLLVEIARADHELEKSELESIQSALRKASSLTEQEITELVNEAVADADASLSLHEHVREVNAQFDQPQKIALIEQMWRVAVADGNIDQYEDYTIRKMSELFHVRHAEFIKAKLRVVG